VHLEATPLVGESGGMDIREANQHLEEHVIWKGDDQSRSMSI
jgi:hypothetical protein